MDTSSKTLCNTLIKSRRQHPAWLLLASRRAPLIISCLKPLFESYSSGIPHEEAEQSLADMLAEHANDEAFAIHHDDYALAARRELRDWIKRELITERQGRLFATDALQQGLDFIDNLNDRVMTSTASRLAIVQREIEILETQLNPDPESRSRHLRQKIKALEQELVQVAQGHVEVLEGSKAREGIREIYNLATSLRSDFRRVEDSYREADRRLRQSIISEQQHRGEVVDKLLDSHDHLLETPEGQVFHNFHEQLTRSVALDNMKQQLRNILEKPATNQALNRQQQSELRRLVSQLISESAGVIKARARSERDVKGFLKTGLAAEHHRVGQLLHEIFETALDIDWSQATLRHQPAPLPPIAISAGNLPLIERLRFKIVGDDKKELLELAEQFTNLDEIDDDFWHAFDTLDRQALIKETIKLLTKTGQPMTIAQLSKQILPTHDLETLALWLSMAREAELPIGAEQEQINLESHEGQALRFHIPKVALNHKAMQNIDWEL
ncbi:MAG: DUF3375 domain-containing protein [Gammaproteobacteria bacterium]|nr:DUF3375 domain-containing protein [Gammaproteobacteria bacterium]